MKIRFWGTRGSVATPGRGTTHYGGNTSCVEAVTDGGVRFIFDSGTGIRVLGAELMATAPGPLEAHILVGHTHWDHIQGFPFFGPIFVEGNRFSVYGPQGSRGSLHETLAGQMEYSYFPVELGQLPARISFHELGEGEHEIAGARVRTQFLHHPATTLGYRLEADGAAVAYVTDHEPFAEHLWQEGEESGRIESILHEGDRLHARFLAGADLVIHDAQYTPEEYLAKKTWGHSTYEYAVEVSAAAEVKRLALTHHDPTHDDVCVGDIEQLARGVAERRGSTLEVFCAREGEGLEVRGTQPRHSEARTTTVAAAAQPVRSVRILVVDDDAVLRELLVRVLGRLGHTLTEAGSGQEALQMVDERTPELILLDLEMPGMHGLEVLRQLRARPAMETVPVLILTGNAGDTETRVGFEAGATDYLTKPFSIPQLTARVHACLARASARR